MVRTFLVTGVALLLFGAPAVAQPTPPFELPSPTALKKLRSAVIETDQGRLIVELYPELAPWHVANFKYLADKEFYDGTLFHIYRPNFIIQGGRPQSERKVPRYSLPPEFSDQQHVPGTLGMARNPDFANPERRSHGYQFHILLDQAPHMNGRYTVFGKVVKGQDVLKRLRQGSVIRGVEVFVRAERESGEQGSGRQVVSESP